MELSVDGRPVFAATGGPDFDPTIPTLVFVHGAGFDRTTWQLQTRYFAHHGFGVLAVDLPGHGRSEGPALPSVEAIADWLAALLDAAGARAASLVGHSMGALAVMACAARHPTRVESVALLGVAERMPVHPELLEAASNNDAHAIDLLIGWSFGAEAHRGGHPNPGTWMTGTGWRMQQRMAPGVLHTDLQACDAFDEGAVLASKMTCPVLFLMGELDKMTPPAGARALIDAVADSTVQILSNAGHMMMIEQPIETRRIIAAFLADR